MTEHHLTIYIDRPPLTSNQARGAHWTKIKQARDAVAWHVRAAGGDTLPKIERCRISITWFAPDRRNRDAGSLTPFGKAVIDSLVDLGVLVKDNAEYVLSETYSVVQASPDPRIVVTVIPELEETAA